MNSFRAVVLFFLVAAVGVSVNAEPPRFRSNRYQFQRQEQDPAAPAAPAASEGSGDAPYPPAVSAPYPAAMPAPYPPSNWKPSGRLFALPVRQAQLRDTYGPPPTPEQPAEPETTEAPVEETTDEAVEGTTTEPQAETIEVEEDKAQEQPEEKNQSERLTQGGPGFYYVQLPQLQQQQVYVQPATAQVETAQLRQFPVAQAAAAVAQPLVIANQPLVVGTTGYYVSTQTW